MNAFVDTNVLIDFICNRTMFYDDAETIFSYALAGKESLCFTDLSVVNTIYVGKKYSFSAEDLANQLSETLEYCSLANINYNVVFNALNSGWKDKEDAIQYFSALESSADCIITRNKKDFELSKIPVMTPAEYLAKVQ